MSRQKTTTAPRTVYPMPLSIGLIITAIVLSFVDLMFLNDVIGKVLDIGVAESTFIAFALGMVGIGIMGHQGMKVAHGQTSFGSSIGHYSLWVFMGLAFVLIRLFSATILQLGEETGDTALLSIFGMSVQEADIVTAPLMMLLYLATGVMVKDGFKHLLSNPDFDKWMADRKQAKIDRKNKENTRMSKAEKKQEEAQRKAESALEDARSAAKKQKESEFHGRSYGQALRQYNEKLEEIKTHYQKVSANIDYIKSIDKQEYQFATEVKPSLMKVVQSSIEGTQNSIALVVGSKHSADIQGLRNGIDIHNSQKK